MLRHRARARLRGPMTSSGEASSNRRTADNLESLVDSGSSAFADDDTLQNDALIAG